MNTDTSKPADAAELMQLLAQGRFQFLQLANAVLSADAAIAGWNSETMQKAKAATSRGDRIVLEISADESGTVAVALVAISPDRKRRELGRAAESAGRAN